MIRGFRNRDLQRLWNKNDERGIRPDWLKKVRILLNALNNAKTPSDLDVPGTGFHRLKGNRADEYAISVSANWRITFRWDGQDAIDIELEDYHGR